MHNISQQDIAVVCATSGTLYFICVSPEMLISVCTAKQGVQAEGAFVVDAGRLAVEEQM
jgi:hypothetical protein